jgi:hypothetical protein
MMYVAVSFCANTITILHIYSLMMSLYIMSTPEAEALMRFGNFLRKHSIPRRSGYNWKDAGILPVIQVGRVIMIRESEALASLERFKRKASLTPGRQMNSSTIPI